MGRGAAAFTPEIAAMLEDREAAVRWGVAHALGQLCRTGAPAAQDVVGYLKAPNADVRSAALFSLGQMGSGEAPFAQEIAALFKDPDAVVRRAAAIALGAIGREASAPEQVACSKTLIRPCRLAAAIALGQVARGAVSEGVALLADRDAKSATSPSLFDERGNSSGDLALQAAFLAATDGSLQLRIAELRAHLRLWAGGNASMQRTVTWLGKADMEPMPKEGLSTDETQGLAVHRLRRFGSDRVC